MQSLAVSDRIRGVRGRCFVDHHYRVVVGRNKALRAPAVVTLPDAGAAKTCSGLLLASRRLVNPYPPVVLRDPSKTLNLACLLRSRASRARRRSCSRNSGMLLSAARLT